MPATLTFADDFNSLSLWNGTSGTWSTSYWYHDLNGNGGSLPSNGEQEWYINANYAPTASVRPWTVQDGVLTLTAAPADPSIQPLINGYKYTSGEINSYHSFSQTYGYFEMRAELPQGQGLWPAFWLLPENGQWPPEIDIMEVLGNDTGTLYTTAHSAASGTHTSSGIGSVVADMSAGYHTYGVDWEADKITWYFDGKAIYSVDTPADMHSPMYIIANLAVGGYWPGNADASTPFPAHMNIDYIHVFSGKPDDITPPAQDPGSNDGGVTRNGVDAHVSTLTGGAGADTLTSQHQADTMTGGAGADVFGFKALPWSAGHVTDFQLGVDRLDFTALFTASGYTGADPIADGYVSLEADGLGGTKVFYDPDGRGTASPWPFLITTLDHVASGGLTAAQLFSAAGAVALPPAPPPPATPPPTGGGVTLSGTDAATSVLTGGTGADTLVSMHMADALTGGAGADTFAFKVLPWNAGHITDFEAGVDRLDFSALFTAAGYAGTDPLADGHVILASDGLGGTRVMFDPDGPAAGNPWPFMITTLDHVSPTGLTAAKLFAGAQTTAPAEPAPPSGPTAVNGVSLSGNDAGSSTLSGGAGADTLSGAHQADVLTGGGAHDTFNFAVLPWNAGHVTDFTPGEDVLDLRGIFKSSTYHGKNPVADGYLILRDDGHGGTQVLVDIDGPKKANPWAITVTTLDHVAPSSLHASDWLIA